MACRSGCKEPGAHKTWGECARAADIQIDRHGLQNSAAEKDKERRLGRYEDARHQGLQPKSTKWKDVRSAFETGGDKQTELNVSGNYVSAAD